MKKRIVLLFIAVFFFSLIPTSFNISGDTQVWENGYGKLEVYPKVSINIVRQKQFFNATSYLPSQDLDFAFRFNDSLSYGSVYTLNNIKLDFEHIEYNNKHWYILKNQYVEQYTTYRGFWEYDVPINTTGKWDLFIKRSSDSLQYAMDNNLYVHLDPWWNSSWLYYKHGEFINKIEDYQSMINVTKNNGGDVNCSGHCQDDFDDLRFVYLDNSTEIPYYLESIHSGSWVHVWLNNTNNETGFLMYYGNPICSNNSDPDTTFDKWIDYNDVGSWTLDIGTDMTVKTVDTDEGITTQFYQPHQPTAEGAFLALGTTFDSGWWMYEAKFKSEDVEGNDQSCMILRSSATNGFRGYIRNNLDNDAVTDGELDLVYNGIDDNISFYILQQPFDTVNRKYDMILYDDYYNNNLGSTTNNNWENAVNSVTDIRQTDGSNAGDYGYKVLYLYIRFRHYTDGTPQTIGNWDEEVVYITDEMLISNPTPINNSVVECLNLSQFCVTVNSTGGSSSGWVNISFNNTIFSNVSFTGNGTFCLNVTSVNFTGGQYYYWNVSASNGSGALNTTFLNFTCAVGCNCYNELLIINYKLNQIINDMIKGSDTIEINIGVAQFGLMINLVLFVFFFWIGYTNEKPSGGSFMILSGFILFALEFLLATYVNVILVYPLMSPFAIFIILLGVKKQFYSEYERGKSPEA